ncbi:MAG: hypothetical protein JNL49_05430 [Bacteroidia bacterium]|nr:hypothetical protein [Bacteroidia bacterium]
MSILTSAAIWFENTNKNEPLHPRNGVVYGINSDITQIFLILKSDKKART